MKLSLYRFFRKLGLSAIQALNAARQAMANDESIPF